ncbi:MAG: hypothetical protein ACLR2O_17170 [Coprococcus sp.]
MSTAGAERRYSCWHRLSADGKEPTYKLLDRAKKSGYVRVRIDGNLYELVRGDLSLDKNIKHTIEIVVDRLVDQSRGLRRD